MGLVVDTCVAADISALNMESLTRNKRKKKQSAHLQFSSLILLLHEGGNWVILSSLLEFQEKYVVTICCTARWAVSSSSFLK